MEPIYSVFREKSIASALFYLFFLERLTCKLILVALQILWEIIPDLRVQLLFSGLKLAKRSLTFETSIHERSIILAGFACRAYIPALKDGPYALFGKTRISTNRMHFRRLNQRLIVEGMF